MSTRTFGPAYDEEIDGRRLATQLELIRDFMLSHPGWWTLEEIHVRTGQPQASISAQLRHLRKVQFGSHRVEKRRRKDFRGEPSGTWEYRVEPPPPPGQTRLF